MSAVCNDENGKNCASLEILQRSLGSWAGVWPQNGEGRGWAGGARRCLMAINVIISHSHCWTESSHCWAAALLHSSSISYTSSSSSHHLTSHVVFLRGNEFRREENAVRSRLLYSKQSVFKILLIPIVSLSRPFPWCVQPGSMLLYFTIGPQILRLAPPRQLYGGRALRGTAGKTAMKSPQLISRKWRNGVDAKFVS